MMSAPSYKTIVRRYFEEALDKRNLDVLDEIVTSDCMIHRPEVLEPIRGRTSFFKETLARILQVYAEFSTTIHDPIADDDRVACRLSHRAVNRGMWTSHLGRHEVRGKAVRWPAIASFRFRNGKIAEEWVFRDELGMLIELGVIGSSPSAA